MELLKPLHCMYPAPQKEIHGMECSAREVYREQLSVSARPQEVKAGALALVVSGCGLLYVTEMLKK
jgi:hypothetical protein